VRLIVQYSLGGPTDLMARLIAQKLTEHLGKQFFIENHAGVGGNISMSNAGRAVPDG